MSDATSIPTHCRNCGTELLGPHCHACGQPIKGLVRHFSSIIGDVLDTVFEYDGRLWRTLAPLLFRPGYLTAEYLAGRQVSYVSPFRLVFFITVLAFLAAQLTIQIGDNDDEFAVGPVTATQSAPRHGVTSGIPAATDIEQLEQAKQAALHGINMARERIDIGDGATSRALLASLETAEQQIHEQAERRRLQIESGDIDIALPEPIAAAEPEDTPTPSAPREETPRTPITINFFGDQPWHPVNNPVRVDWLSDGLNHRLNRNIGRAVANMERIRDDPDLLKDAFLSALPLMLFMMLPVFALLLKVLYIFKRRLYMEHLIVGMHSHAFLSACLLVLVLLNVIKGWTASVAWLTTVITTLEVLLAMWMPLYLFLMQKKIYAQGWIMTFVKYSITATCYQLMLVFAAVFTLMLSVASM